VWNNKADMIPYSGQRTMTIPDPAQQIPEDIRALQTRIGSLQESVQLIRTRKAIEDVQTNVNGMTRRIAILRRPGYVFVKDLEGQAQAFMMCILPFPKFI
jgi:hypothetical protein